MQHVFKFKIFLLFARKHFSHRNSRPRADDARNIFFRNFLPQKRCAFAFGIKIFLPRFRRSKLFFKSGNFAVFQLRRFFKIAFARKLFHIKAALFKLRLNASALVDVGLFVLPLEFHRIPFGRNVGKLFFKFFKPFDRSRVRFFCKRLLFNRQLQNFALKLVKFRRLTFDFHFKAACRFVYKVNRLVRHKAIRDIAAAQHRRRNERLVVYAHSVMNLILFAESAQNRNRIVNGRLSAVDLLEPPLKSRVFFYILAVFVERCSTYRTESTARQSGFQKIGRIHRAFSGSRADNRVQFVDE